MIFPRVVWSWWRETFILTQVKPSVQCSLENGKLGHRIYFIYFLWGHEFDNIWLPSAVMTSAVEEWCRCFQHAEVDLKNDRWRHTRPRNKQSNLAFLKLQRKHEEKTFFKQFLPLSLSIWKRHIMWNPTIFFSMFSVSLGCSSKTSSSSFKMFPFALQVSQRHVFLKDFSGLADQKSLTHIDSLKVTKLLNCIRTFPKRPDTTVSFSFH